MQGQDLLVQKILEERYLLRDKKGQVIETPEQMYYRVAQTMGNQEKSAAERKKWTDLFLQGLIQREWCPSSPCLMNAGTSLQQLSACFILEIDDSMESIFSTLKNAALIYKTGGGVGFNFGKLREKGAIISSTGGYSSGTTAWLKVYDTAIEAIAQGGKRRGAALGLLPVSHPDILEWIRVKAVDREINNFNISVAVTADFMEAVDRDAVYSLTSPLMHIVRPIPARELWEKLCYQAWATGEPGLFFIDRANRDNPNPHLGRISGANPCSEFLAIPDSSCNLASINLEKHLRPKKGGGWTFDWDKFGETITIVTRFLDNMIDANRLPLPKLQKVALATRPIGLGFMGLARVVKALGLSYRRQEGRIWTEKMAKYLREETEKASRSLAAERGVYPSWPGSLWEKKGIPIRNSHLLSIAPTGTIATLAGTSWSLEPEFAPIYQRRVLGGKIFWEMDPQLAAEIKRMGLESPGFREELEKKGSIQEMDQFTPEQKEIFVYALDIKPIDHLKMQAAVQKYVDGAISKTVNLPAQATLSGVAEAFRLAYDLDLKGCTVYRQGTRLNQVLSLTSTGEKLICSDSSCPSC